MIDRRHVVSLMSAAAVMPGEALAQPTAGAALKSARTTTLDIAYEESGPPAGIPVLLMHGFPYDPRGYDAVVPRLTAAGCRTIVPYLRGYGPTRFLSAATPRSGQQAAIGRDLLDLMDALAVPRAVVAGFDWGGRAACVAAALWPQRVRGLVSATGYTIQDIAGANAPASPEQEHRFWYQYYFNTERGRAGLQKNRRELTRLLWQLWSPAWKFDDATFERTAQSFDNPDFVEVVIHSYRHRFGNAPGDPAFESYERQLVARPPISVPTVVLHGEANGIAPASGSAAQGRFFTGPYRREVLAGIGHNVPQEAPGAVADAILELVRTTG